MNFHSNDHRESSFTDFSRVAGGGKTLAICGICGRPFDMALSTARPFCSSRCRQVDLARWENEEYGLPWEDLTAPPDESGNCEQPD